MIPAITEVNFPSYATLHQATVSLQEMGDRSISTQVRINGSVVPDFTGWELQFKGERFVLPTRTPQAQKDNTTKNALVDLQFQSWVIEQLKSYFFVSLSEYETGKYIPDQYNASVILPLESFVQLFNKVLTYYFGTSIRMDLFGAGTPGLYSTTPVTVEINKTYIWDVLIKFYELFGVRWYIAYEQGTGAYVIKVGYAAEAITDHDFEYGYQGGLLKFERHVQDADVRNILIGRGGEKNLPYRYFKLQDPNNTAWEADPDAIPELANIYFDRLRDINFRWYVRGWMQNSHRDTSWDSTHTFPQYTENDCPESHLFAFRKGKTDESFDPVEYVKDDDSITKYGERWGAVDDNDGVYPTIQGMTRSGVGRVDECVAVSDIVTDDIDAAAATASTTSPIGGTKTITKTVPANGNATDDLLSEPFTIPSGQTGNIEYSWLNPRNQGGQDLRPDINLDATVTNLVAVDESTGTEYPIGGLQAGTYRIKITLKAVNSTSSNIQATYGVDTMSLVLSSVNENAWKPTFDIWVKNIWGTEFQDEEHPTETAAQYATRVWEKILGDRAGNEAKLVFSDGFMSTSQDYEFVIAAYPVFDQGKSITVLEDGEYKTYQSEWKITLYKSDAEFEATGLYIPNSKTGGKPSAGDHFFFIGIDMPFLYVTAAEERLNGADLTPVVNKTAALEDLADVQPTWVITLDKVRVNTLEAGEYGRTLAERLSAGATVRIKDPRFTPGQTLTLYVKSITYTWNEPTSGNPYLVPDIEVVLSDTVAAVEGTVTRVTNELNVVKATYAKNTDVEAAVRSVGNALFLKKTGESDNSNSPTTFASKVSSKSFRQGDIGGAGWGFYEEETEEEEKNDSVLEIDKLVVRKELHVNELVANQISYVGGKKITSAAAIECTQVIDDNSYYYCYFDQKQGTVANLFQVGDFAMGQDFDEENVEVRYYRMQVAEVGANYIKLSKSVKDGSGAPVAGDTIIQYGNPTDTTRQFVIVEDVIGGGYIRMISGLSTVSSDGDEYVFLGRQNNTHGSNSGSGAGTGSGPRAFIGDHNGENIEWVDGALNIKGLVTVRKSDGTYQNMATFIDNNDVSYLKAATNNGTTLVDGGLILTNLIALGQTNSDQFQINAGINGIMNSGRNRLGGGVAAWFGGIPSDKDDLDTGITAYAKSLFRFDGSGYLAGGNIHWDNNGYGGIPGITWSRPSGAQQDVITIGANVMLEQTGGTDSSVTDLITLVRNVSNMFVEDTYTDSLSVQHKRVKVNPAYYEGLITEGYFTSHTSGQGGGGGGGGDLTVHTIADLTNGTQIYDDATNVFNAYTVKELHARIVWLEQHPGGVTSVAGLTGAVSAANLLTELGLSALSGYGVASSVVSGDTTHLVTGAAVHTAINNAISSVMQFEGVSSTEITDGGTETPTIDGVQVTPYKGMVVLYGAKEFVWLGSAWEQLGDEASWALKTTQVIAGTGLSGGGQLTSNVTISLAASGVTAGTYKSVTVDTYGRVTAGSNPTTLAGYGITDAVPSSRKVNNHALSADITLSLDDVADGSTRKLSDYLTVADFNKMFIEDSYTDSSGTHKRIKVNPTYYEGLITVGYFTSHTSGQGGGGGTGGLDVDHMWASLQNNPYDTGYETAKFHYKHLPAINYTDGISAGYSYGTDGLAYQLNIGISSIDQSKITGLSTALAGKADASALAGYLPKDGSQSMTGAIGLYTGSTTDSWNVPNSDGKMRLLMTGGSQPEGSPGYYMSGYSFMTAYSGFQLATYGGYSNNHLYFRKWGDSSPYWSDWFRIWHTGNAGTVDYDWYCYGLYVLQAGGIYTINASGGTARKIYGVDSTNSAYARIASYAMIPDNDADDAWQVRPMGGAYADAHITVLHGGNVGIWTTTPIANLDIYGRGNTTPVLAFTRPNSRDNNIFAAKIALEDAGSYWGDLVFKVKTTTSASESSSYYTEAMRIAGVDGKITMNNVLTIAPPSVSSFQDGIVLYDSSGAGNEGLKIRWTSYSYPNLGGALYVETSEGTLYYQNANGVYNVLHSGNYSSWALPKTGGSMNTNSHISVASTDSYVAGASSYTGGLEVREYKYLQGTTDGMIYGPGITFHWYGKWGDKLWGDISGNLKWGDNIILHSGNYSNYALPLSGGTISSSGGFPLTLDTTSATYNYLTFKVSGTTKGYVGYYPGDGAILQNVVAGTYFKLPDAGGLQFYDGSAYRTVWTSGNDGSGSGLDADLLDGYHASAFLQKLDYEYNFERSFGSSGVLLIGRFACYDSNVTIDISTTGGTPYHCTFVMATQNINSSGGGSINAQTFGDYANFVTPNIYIHYPSDSSYIEIYLVPQPWGKNTIHVKACGIGGAADVNTSLSSLPSKTYIQPSNASFYLNGNVGIGNPNPQYKLDVVGVINASTGFRTPGYLISHTSASSSDARLKDDIKTISADRAFEVLMALKPREWVWNEKNGESAWKKGAGLVAQEVIPVLDEAVFKSEPYLHLNYDMLHGYEISGLQYLKSETDLLKEKVNTLEGEVVNLKAENAQLKARLQLN